MPAHGSNEPVGDRTPRRRSGTELTTQRILDAAAVEFIESGYDRTRISSVARRAGLTPGAVYARWQNKSELMAATLDHIFEKILPGTLLADSNLENTSARVALQALGKQLLEPDGLPHVMVNVFAGARNNPDLQTRLQAFLNKEAGQLELLIEAGKENGTCNPGISTPALTFLCQSLGLGIELLQGSGLDSRHVPSDEQWSDLIERFLAVLDPQGDSAD